MFQLHTVCILVHFIKYNSTRFVIVSLRPQNSYSGAHNAILGPKTLFLIFTWPWNNVLVCSCLLSSLVGCCIAVAVSHLATADVMNASSQFFCAQCHVLITDRKTLLPSYTVANCFVFTKYKVVHSSLRNFVKYLLLSWNSLPFDVKLPITTDAV